MAPLNQGFSSIPLRFRPVRNLNSRTQRHRNLWNRHWTHRLALDRKLRGRILEGMVTLPVAIEAMTMERLSEAQPQNDYQFIRSSWTRCAPITNLRNALEYSG
jgi:hypothetical protein